MSRAILFIERNFWHCIGALCATGIGFVAGFLIGRLCR